MAKPTSWSFSTASIDTANWGWFWSGSYFMIPMWENTGATLNSIGTISTPFVKASGVNWVNESNGIGLSFGAIAGQYASQSTPRSFGKLMSQSSHTVYSQFRVGTHNAYPYVYGDTDRATYSVLTRGFVLVSNAIWSQIGTTVGGLYSLNTGVSTSSGSLYTCVSTWNSTTKAVTMYINATSSVYTGTAGGDTMYSQSSATEDGIYIGQSGPTTNGNLHTWGGNILLFGAQQTIWTGDQINQFLNNPYGPITQYTAPTPQNPVKTTLTGTNRIIGSSLVGTNTLIRIR